MAEAPKTQTLTVELPAVGQEGDICASCGAGLAVDQRYCLNCGTARAGSRLDFRQYMGPAAGNGAGGNDVVAAADGAGAARPPASSQWSPLLAVGAIGILGVMLLLGVLIGKDENEPTVAAAPAATTTTAAPAATAPAATAAAPAPDAGKADKNAAAATAPGAGNVVQGGSGSTEGVPTESGLEGLTGKDLQEAQKNAPDVVATEGEKAPLDPNGQAGGGSDATCIGC